MYSTLLGVDHHACGTRSIYHAHWSQVAKCEECNAGLWLSQPVYMNIHTVRRRGLTQVGRLKEELSHRCSYEPSPNCLGRSLPTQTALVSHT
ncbi:hypothetical protein PISMIDRAFT_291484 [Pisolithus microcarpus 441]|uniref:Uncharacterized protein n=1 Tax=Pisolithus microcarpus 441 TaxID=765257 RepID=A0A0C9Z020_9AGAM|nr:hypothetical protein PISMIDRAFT_291484 [Pisolithus microcarpus 441]